ncbi:MAG: helix-turn-helix domain-containing protein [Actinobacteria bacterium]|nr:helix-turn-helix domain-containing protein [Actinomycetota bacterium]
MLIRRLSCTLNSGGLERDAAVTDAIDQLFEHDPPTIGPTEVAARLNTTTRTVYTWLRDGIIPGYKLGTSWFVIVDELKAELRKGANIRRSNGPDQSNPETATGE